MARPAMPTFVGRFRADTLSALADGASVTSWSDSVGGRALTPGGTAPVKVASGFGGKPTVRFNGTSQWLQQATGTPAVAHPVTITWVGRLSGAPGSGKRQVTWFTGTSGSTAETGIFTGKFGAWGGGYVEVNNDFPVADTPYVVITTFNGTSSSLTVNGKVLFTGDLGTIAIAAGRLIVGNHSDGVSYWLGDISEIGISQKAWTADDRQAYNSYAQDYYGMSVLDYTADTASDATAPTITSFTATGGNAQVALAWAGTDNVAITRWVLTRGGTTIYDGTATSFTDTGRTNGTALSYGLTAYDAAGNTKTASASATPAAAALPVFKSRVAGAWVDQVNRIRAGGAWISVAHRVLQGIAAAAGFQPALGSLTARPSWTNSTIAAGPVDQPILSRTRTLQLPNLPAAGSDLSAAWVAYFGNQTGTTGTWAAGDRVTIPAGEWPHAGNLDIPPVVNDVELVLGSSSGACTLTATDSTAGNETPPRIGLRVLSANNIRIRAASQSYPAVLRARGMAGRGDKNQQGHALLEVEFCTGFRAQDLIVQDSKAAGIFMYRADTYWFNRCRVERSKADAWHATNGCSYGTYSDCSSDGAGDDMLAFVHYDGRDAPISVSHHMEVYRYIGKRNGHGRGFAVIACRDIYADQVIIEGSAAASVIIDRESVDFGSQAQQSISSVLLQRFLLIGGNWSEQDHGSVFIGNGNTAGTVSGVQLESFRVRDNRFYTPAVRAVGSGTMNVVFKDFIQSGALTTTEFDNRNKIGGNWVAPSTMTQTNWMIDTSNQTDTTAPTVVINSPGHLSTVTGTLTGASGGNTHLMTNAQAIQFYVGDSPAGITSMSVTVDGSTGNGLGTPTARDSAGRGSVVWNTTAVANGAHTITVTGTDAGGLSTSRSITVTVAN